MRTFFLFALCIVVYSTLLIFLPIQIFPEFFFYPWLVAKGVVQYKSFFDHHGFLTNIFLSPFSSNVTLIGALFVMVQIDQFVIIAYLVAKKIKQPLLYFLLLVLYFSFQFTIVQQQLWYDAGMAFFLVTAWLFFEKKKEYIAWFFVACATMIKPTALIFLIPIYMKSKEKKSIVTFFVTWFFAFFYFISRGAIGELWKQLILFNYVYIQSTYKTFFIGISFKLLISICIGFGTLIFFAMKKKQKDVPLLLMTLFSFSFFLQGFSKLNFALFVPFCILLISEVIYRKKLNKITLIILFIFTLIIVRDAYKTVVDCQKRQVYLSPLTIREARQVGGYIQAKKDKTILVIGNRVELYYFLNVLPPEFTPLHFPWVEKVYKTDINLKGIYYIIVPKQFGEYESLSTTVKKALQKNFSQIGETASYRIWRYNGGITQ